MQFYQVLLGIFIFLAIECQASTDVTEILKEGSFFGGTSKVLVSRFEKGDITEFFLEDGQTQGFTKDKQDLFVQSLFNDDNANIFFTYAILKKARDTLDACTTQSRAATLFRIIEKNEQIKTALESSIHKVIILDRKQITLGASIESRNSLFSSPSKTSFAPKFEILSENDIAEISNRLGVKFNAKREAASEDDDLADKGAVIASLIEQIKADKLAATQAVQEAMTAQMSSTWSLITSTGFSKTEVKKGLGKDPITPEEALFGALVFASQAVDDKVNLEVELEELRSTRVIQETVAASAKVLSTVAIPSHDYGTEIARLIQSPTRVDKSNQDVLIPSLKDQIKAIRLARTKVLGDVSKGIQMSDALTLIKSAGFSQTEVKKGLVGKDPTSAEEALRGALTFANQEVNAKTDLEVELEELKSTLSSTEL